MCASFSLLAWYNSSSSSSSSGTQDARPPATQTHHIRAGSAAAGRGQAVCKASGVARGRHHGVRAQVLGHCYRCAREQAEDSEREGPRVSIGDAGDLKFQHLALDDRDAAAHKSRRGTQVSTRCLMSSHLMAVIWASRPPSRAAQPGLHSRRLCVGIGDLRVVAAVEWADAPGVTLAVVHVQGGVETAAAGPRRDESIGGGGVLVELRSRWGRVGGRGCVRQPRLRGSGAAAV